MKKSMHRLVLAAICTCALLHSASINAADPNKPHPYRLPSVSLKQQVIWGSICEAPDGTALSFGGEDRDAEDGLSHTRLRVNGEWIDLRAALEKDSPREAAQAKLLAARGVQKALLSRLRSIYFESGGANQPAQATELAKATADAKSLSELLVKTFNEISTASQSDKELAKALESTPQIVSVLSQAREIASLLENGVTKRILVEMRASQVDLESIADALGAEPSARALSPIVFEPKTHSFVLFGGDHGDYLTNDLWVFDIGQRRWSMRRSDRAPQPRANHAWKSDGDGKLTLIGGYTYFSNTDYMGGQYIDIKDGDWIYDVSANTWTGSGDTIQSGARTYRTGPFLPEYFYDGPAPNAADFQATLKALPANVWTKTNPPKLPVVNRDWGTAVIDPDRDLILRFSGGHCAHGGSDVITYHLATNRWELCYPVEFPLGQLYDNTEYPGGWNFNHRPWVSGHTYQNYGVDPVSKKMIFLGHSPWGYVYDPDKGDWTTRHKLPKLMDYSGSMYTLTTTPTPGGLICWTDPDAAVLRFDAATTEWKKLPITGEKLPGSSVDNSTVIYDSHRDRLLFFRKEYGDKKQYDGEIYALDMKTLVVTKLSPANKDAAAGIPYLCQIRYDAEHDMLLVGATLPPGADGVRRTPIYDCAANEWMSVKIAGVDPSGKQGRNVSLGLMYDARRKLFWAVDTNSNVYVLKFDPKAADMTDLQ